MSDESEEPVPLPDGDTIVPRRDDDPDAVPIEDDRDTQRAVPAVPIEDDKKDTDS
ncbi:MAG: hypothetical protein H7Z41_00620 [Cytophagales bacterium]|nr:hypothetical protein [Armatimonadota bacterium]